MYIMNILDSDAIFYVLIALLACISLAMFYLIYTQNKEISMEMQRRREMHKVDEDEKLTKDLIDLDTMRKEEVILHSNRDDLLEPTDMKIPDSLEYTQSIYMLNEEELVKTSDLEISDIYNQSQSNKLEDKDDLQAITRELEMIPRERKIDMTPYEEEQEEKAIISYDELLSKTSQVNLDYNEINNELPIEVPKIKKVVEEKEKVEVISYEHEEEFLRTLKQLQELLN